MPKFCLQQVAKSVIAAALPNKDKLLHWKMLA